MTIDIIHVSLFFSISFMSNHLYTILSSLAALLLVITFLGDTRLGEMGSDGYLENVPRRDRMGYLEDVQKRDRMHWLDALRGAEYVSGSMWEGFVVLRSE